MAITQGRVQANIGQLAPPHVLLLGGDIREDDLAILQTELLGSNVDICLTDLRNNVRKIVGRFMPFLHT